MNIKAQEQPAGEVHRDPTMDFVYGLRELADILADNLEAAVHGTRHYTHYIWCESAEQLARLAKSIGGKWDKYSDEFGLGLKQELTDRVTLDITISHSAAACERVVVGTKTVEVPDPTVEVPLVKVEQEVTEWRCPPSIMAAMNAKPTE